MYKVLKIRDKVFKIRAFKLRDKILFIENIKLYNCTKEVMKNLMVS